MVRIIEKVKMINDALSQVDSRYRLPVILFKRARMLNQGDQPLVPPRFAKEYFIALDEFLAGKLEWKKPYGEWKKVNLR